MTRRIAISILAAAWTILIVGGAVAYTTTRSVLLNELDASILARASALPELIAGGTPSRESQNAGDRYVVRNEAGQTLDRPPVLSKINRAIIADRRFSRLGNGLRIRTLTLHVPASPAGASALTVIYSGSAEQFDEVLNHLVIALATASLLAGAAAAVAAAWVARASLRPLHTATAVIGSIDEAHLDQRIDDARLPPELRTIAVRLNEMLARLEEASNRQRRFMAEASHELRTPVAALITAMEVGLRRPRDAASLTRLISECLGDAVTLRHLVEALMRQVRAETPGFQDHAESFDLVPLLQQCVGAAERLGAGRQISLSSRLPDRLMLTSQPGRIRSMVTNLLSNAVEYSHAGGEVVLACDCGDAVTLSVRDAGLGIAPEAMPHIFDAFYRGPDQRKSDGGHLGLGLALVKAHATALGGRCEVESDPGRGATFRVLLPRSVIVASGDRITGKATESSSSHVPMV